LFLPEVSQLINSLFAGLAAFVPVFLWLGLALFVGVVFFAAFFVWRLVSFRA